MSLSSDLLSGAKLAQWSIVGLAVVAVAVADIFLKKATLHNDLGAALRSPWLWGAVALYLLQISFFTFAFVSGWKLSALGALQTALYAVVVLVAGVVLYRETLTPAQVLGVALALGGVTLINWR
jgi:multidrug transporter EmrE-like cation transporter